MMPPKAPNTDRKRKRENNPQIQYRQQYTLRVGAETYIRLRIEELINANDIANLILIS
jgi:hypothetical protein